MREYSVGQNRADLLLKNASVREVSVEYDNLIVVALASVQLVVMWVFASFAIWKFLWGGTAAKRAIMSRVVPLLLILLVMWVFTIHEALRATWPGVPEVSLWSIMAAIIGTTFFLGWLQAFWLVEMVRKSKRSGK
jgi:type IV secretory pathway TrbL component